MDFFNYRDGVLHAEDVSLIDIADCYGTPCYIYSKATLERHWHAFDKALGCHPHLICYAVKANSNLAILHALARLNSGFDIVSIGELERVLLAGGDPSKVVFSGVGKRADEIHRGLEVGIRCFNVEGADELERIDTIAAEMGYVAPVSLRINPDVDVKTHPYIATGLKENKFGIDFRDAVSQYQHAASLSHVKIIGIDCHIGSQLTEIQPFLDALERILSLAEQLDKRGIEIHHLDLGGGLGVCYRDESPPEPAHYAGALLEKLTATAYEIILEPGRAIAANAGILLTRVEYLKPTRDKNFAIVDAAMNDLLRPALYKAWQQIIPVKEANQSQATQPWDIVGPVCETGDFLGKERQLDLKTGDLLAVRSSGAYGFTMSSNYNSRPRPAEIMVEHDRMQIVREREKLLQLWEGEQVFKSQ